MIVKGDHGQEFERVVVALPTNVETAFAAESRRLPMVMFDDDGCAIGKDYTIHNPTIILASRVPLRMSRTARIDSFCKIEVGQGMTVGDFVHIASYAHIGIGGGVTILEDGTSFASGSKVISGSNVAGGGRSCSATAPGNRVEQSFVWIRRNAVLFAGAMVVPGVTVGACAVIAAGAVVLEDVPAREIWGGCPARKIGEVQ